MIVHEKSEIPDKAVQVDLERGDVALVQLEREDHTQQEGGEEEENVTEQVHVTGPHGYQVVPEHLHMTGQMWERHQNILQNRYTWVGGGAGTSTNDTSKAIEELEHVTEQLFMGSE